MKPSNPSRTAIDEYIDRFPPDVQARLLAVRATIRREAPDAVEKISYRIPTFYLNGNLVHFAAFAHHVGFYPTPSAIATFRRELVRYKSSKGAVQFPHTERLPLTLIARIAGLRVNESARKGVRRRTP